MQTISITLNVGGMDCDGCANSVMIALEDVVGVVRADVNLDGGWALVEFDPAKTDRSRLAAAVTDAGFDVS